MRGMTINAFAVKHACGAVKLYISQSEWWRFTIAPSAALQKEVLS
jgi:hypothetical protein